MALLGLLAVLKSRYDAHVAADAVIKEKLTFLYSQADSLKKIATRTDTLYKSDTIRLTRTRVRTDSVLAYARDTIIHVDTVRMLIADERKACSVVVATCEERVRIAQAERDNLREQLRLVEQSRPSRLSRALGAAKWALVGAGAAVLLERARP